MITIIKRAFLPLTVSLILSGMLAITAMAASGVGVGPSHIEIQDALRGAEYERSMMVFNSGDEDTEYALSSEGEAASWVSFFVQGIESNTVVVPAGNKGEVTLKVTIPEDTANGEYTANIVVSSIPKDLADDDSSGQSLSLATQSQLTVHVTGTQIVDAKVNGISAEDVEVGYPLVIKVFLENNGNVAVTPMIDVNISSEVNTIDTFSYNETTVGPGQSQFINVEWDTTGNVPAGYGARVSISVEGDEIAEEDLTFNILPLGTLTRSGELREIVVEGTPTVDVVSKIRATFANTGQINAWAEFAGEIYFNDSLIETVKSDRLMVEVDRQEYLLAYFTPEEEGIYSIRGYVTYEGKRTDSKEVTFTAADAAIVVTDTDGGEETLSPSQSANLVVPIVGGIVGALVLAVIIIFTVPWVKLQPARKVLLTRWMRLKMACRMFTTQRKRI